MTYFMIPCVWNMQNWKMHRDGKTSDSQGKMGVTGYWDRISFGGDWNVFSVVIVVQPFEWIFLKTTEFHMFVWYALLFVSNASVEWLVNEITVTNFRKIVRFMQVEPRPHSSSSVGLTQPEVPFPQGGAPLDHWGRAAAGSTASNYSPFPWV